MDVTDLVHAGELNPMATLTGKQCSVANHAPPAACAGYAPQEQMQ